MTQPGFLVEALARARAAERGMAHVFTAANGTENWLRESYRAEARSYARVVLTVATVIEEFYQLTGHDPDGHWWDVRCATATEAQATAEHLRLHQPRLERHVVASLPVDTIDLGEPCTSIASSSTPPPR